MNHSNFQTLITLALVIIAMTTATAESVQAQQMYAEYDIKWSEIFPEQAEQIRQSLRSERERIEDDIRRAQSNGEFDRANQLIQEGRDRMSGLMEEVRYHCPPTPFALHGHVDGSDIDVARQALRSGRFPIGLPVHIYKYNGVVQVSSSVPTQYDGQRYDNQHSNWQNQFHGHYSDTTNNAASNTTNYGGQQGAGTHQSSIPPISYDGLNVGNIGSASSGSLYGLPPSGK